MTTNSDSTQNPSPTRIDLRQIIGQWQNIISTVVSLAVLGLFIFLFRSQVSHFVENRHLVLDTLNTIRSYVETYEGLSSVLFVLMYFVGNSLFVPQFVLGLTGGLIFGFPLGIVFVLIGLAGSSQTYFWLARRFGKRFIQWFGHVEWAIFRDHLSDVDDRTMLKLRLNPMMPYHPLNASCGLYDVPIRVYLTGTLLGLFPRVFTYVLLGASLAPESNLFYPAVIVWIVLTTLHVLFGIWHSRSLLGRFSENNPP